MGLVIDFPDARRVVRLAAADAPPAAGATVVILPAVRIERHADEAPGGSPGGPSASDGGARRPRAR